MIGLIVIIIACVMTHNEARKSQINSFPYILATILLGIVPSIIVTLLFGGSVGTAIFSAILTIALSFIPYNIVKGKHNNSI